MSQFTVGYERKLSDGNYGSEGLSMTWTWTNDDAEQQEVSGEAIEVAASFLRKTVLAHLARSAAARVAFEARRELNPPTTEPAAATVSESIDPRDLEDLPF